MSPRHPWGALAAAGVAYEVYGIYGPRQGDTLSEVTRWAFRTHTRTGQFVFMAVTTALAGWFIPHILNGGD